MVIVYFVSNFIRWEKPAKLAVVVIVSAVVVVDVAAVIVVALVVVIVVVVGGVGVVLVVEGVNSSSRSAFRMGRWKQGHLLRMSNKRVEVLPCKVQTLYLGVHTYARIRLAGPNSICTCQCDLPTWTQSHAYLVRFFPPLGHLPNASLVRFWRYTPVCTALKLSRLPA